MIDVKEPEEQSLAYRVANLNVSYPKIEQVWHVLDSIRTQNKYKEGTTNYGKRHISVIGPSGVGKSQGLLKYEELNKGITEISADKTIEVDTMPVVYVELPDPFTIKELYQHISHALGFPELPQRISIGDAQRQAFHLLREQKVEVLILDELDYILSSNVTYKAAMNAIKKIANKANITLVLAGTPEAEELLKINFQNYRRYPKMYINRFEQCDEEWCRLLERMEESLALQDSIGLGDPQTKLPQILHSMSFGLLGILTPIIQEMYSLLGVFDGVDKEVTFTSDTLEVLKRAYQNINGDLPRDEFTSMLGKGY
ncbi:TniB family NTP-binding protein [Paenibacillus taichungensis]|uniref:TniB family NTP-binding protein n=1 Tax=Paenibacillus taichungensis TaxID=484184 RepID=UPI002DBAADDE|nr:TniB family NTP-binding protein [Paenibacillus taichungensis]MEC0105359.1 TniB family NTP-binding protein [Paenibacillus taichungensis]MEC0200434.1 TniB family NTP-binding protein [Paenibacillus taichungensis]